MSKASISEIKANFSRYIREVRRGGEVQVLDRGTPVAWLKPAALSSGDEDEEEQEAILAKLIADGVLRAGKGGCEQVLEQPPLKLGVSVLEALIEDRRDRF